MELNTSTPTNLPTVSAKAESIPAATSSAAMEGMNNALKDIVFGSIAGMTGKVVEYPFDTVKVRLQSQPDHLPLRYAGPLDCFRQSIAQEGFRSLYRGISAPLFGAAAEASSLFFAYRIAQDGVRATAYPLRKPDEKLPLPALCLCGGISGAFTSLVLTPIELVKCRMQVPIQSSIDLHLGPRNQQTNRLPGPFGVIASVYRADGLLGFWRGQLGTLIREMGGSAAWFGTYESLKLYYRTSFAKANPGRTIEADDIAVPFQMLFGACAGVSYNFLFYPADTIKSKMQTEDIASGSGRRTFLTVGRALWRAHGLKGLYRGCGVTCMRSAPSSAIIFAIYEGLSKAFK